MGLLAATTTSDKVITTMPEALINTGLGMGTVFIVLILISFIIYLLKFVPMLLERSSRKEEAAQAAPVPAAPVAPAPVAAPADDTQLVAVITAAIEASMEAEGTPVPAGGLVIRSIKKRY